MPALYGHQWVEVGQLGQTFALMMVTFALNLFASPVLSTLEKGSHMRTPAVLQLILAVSLIMLAVPYGVLAVAWAYVRGACLTLPLQMWYHLWRRWYHATDSLGASVASFFASAIMGIAVCDCWNSPDPFDARAAYRVVIGVTARGDLCR